jgi:hypothetical protein
LVRSRIGLNRQTSLGQDLRFGQILPQSETNVRSKAQF